MQLVLSLNDNLLYIRKYTTIPESDYRLGGEHEPLEVGFSIGRYMFPQIGFPEIVSWHPYGTSEDDEGNKVSSFSMIFKRYNGGSLFDLAERYHNRIPKKIKDEMYPPGSVYTPINKKKQSPGEEESSPDEQNQWWIPEAFLWHFLKSISYILAYLQTGYTRERGIKPDWNPILHRDLNHFNLPGL